MKKLILAAAILIAGCATYDNFRESRELIESGHEAEGLAQLEKLVQENPKDVELRNYYVSRREVALQRQLALGGQARAAGAFDRAAAAYRQALEYDPENARAKQGLAAIEADRQDRAELARANEALKRGEEDAAYETAKRILERYEGRAGAEWGHGGTTREAPEESGPRSNHERK